MFLKTSQYWSLFQIKLQAIFLQNTCGCFFWIFAAPKTSFSLITRSHLGKKKIFHMNTRKWASPARRDSMARLSGKKQLFYAQNIFLTQHRLVFVDMKYFFVQHQHIFVDTKLLFVQRQTFCFNRKLLFVEHQIFVLDIV